MTPHEIKPKQLRALLLLLVLVPFIPMVLMLRFMTDALHGERDAAMERAANVYRETLGSADASLAKHLAARAAPPKSEDVRAFYRTLFDREIEVAIRDDSGKIVAGPASPPGRLIAQAWLKVAPPAWQAQLYLVDDSAIRDEVRDQFKIYAWTALISVVAICGIAAAAGLTVSRQLRLHELKSTSLATIAHELRTPLSSMRMLVDTIREGRCPEAEKQAEYLDLIAAENLRLSRLTENFLALSRLESGRRKFDFASLAPISIAAQASQMLASRLTVPDCEFREEIESGLPEVRGDRDALVTVLTNLLENALKYSGTEKQIGLHVSAESAGVKFAVSDNGIGLSEADRRHIFDPFFQADQKLSRTREGCGLGLSIVREIVAAHGGKIEVTSEENRGSTFTFTLPVA